MNKINFYGKEYDIIDEIVCDCGCKFKKDNSIGLVSFSNIFLCEEHSPKIDLEKKLKELKDLKINEIKDKTKNIIISRYSENTQRNIDALRLNTETNIKYTTTDRTNMWNWIDNIRLQGKQFQNEIKSEEINTIEKLYNYTYEFEV